VSPVLEALARRLDATTAAIRAAVPSETTVRPADGADPSTVAQPLAQLKKLLADDDGEAFDFILDARPCLSRVLTSAEIDTLLKLVGDFSYAEALRSLSTIATRLSLTLE
jgi:hypothetical protein